MSAPLFSPQDKVDWLNRKRDWGESGPSFAIAQDRVIIATERTNIELNARGNVPKNQAEQQKQRTFVVDGS